MSAESMDIAHHRAGTLNLSALQHQQPSSQPSSCMWDCDQLLGPLSDLFVSGIPPPPPIPVFLRDPVEYLAASNGSCDLCRWAAGEDVQFVEVTRKYPVVDDVWYFVIVSAVIGALLFTILFVIAMLRCKEAKVKPLHDPCSASKVVEKVLPARDPPPPLGAACPSPPCSTMVPPYCGQPPKALWSALKSDSGYSLHHQPITPELLACTYERINYGSIGHNTFGPPPARSPPPPPPLLPPPPLPPCRPFAYCTTESLSTARRPHARTTAVPSAIDEHGNVHIMGNGNAYYANPDSLDGFFENGGYIDSECSNLEVRKVAPDGAVIGRRGSSTKGRAGGGCGLGGWDEAVLRQRVEAIPGIGGTSSCSSTSSFRENKVPTTGRHYILPPPGSRLNVSAKVSSPLV